MRILLLIRALDVGGAERQLVHLAQGFRRAGHAVSVAVLYTGGRLEDDLKRADVSLISLDKRGRYQFIRPLQRLIRIIRRQQPDVVYTVLTAANLLGVALRVFVPSVRVVGTVRASKMDLTHYDRWIRFTSALEPWMARFTDRIIANSEAGLVHAVASGFPRQKMALVRNGIDTDYFRFLGEGRGRLRAELGIDENQQLVGLVGRVDPMKDHATFLRASAIVASRQPAARFWCVGGGPETNRRELERLGHELGLEGRLHWSETRSDMPSVYSALDVLALSSVSEGTPNVVAEAMACCTPCVVTDVGDAAWVVGDTGKIVPPRNPDALAAGIVDVLERGPTIEERRAMRDRIVDTMGIARLIRETETVLREAVAARP